VKKTSISDPLGNSGFLIASGTDKEPIFIIKKPKVKSFELLEKEVEKEPDGHALDEQKIAKSVILDWRQHYDSHKPQSERI
jgi:hypothetical protein